LNKGAARLADVLSRTHNSDVVIADLLTQPRCACCGHELLFRDEIKAVLAVRANSSMEAAQVECDACGFGPLCYQELTEILEVRRRRQDRYRFMTNEEVRAAAAHLHQEGEDLKRYAEELARYAADRKKQLVS